MIDKAPLSPFVGPKARSLQSDSSTGSLDQAELHRARIDVAKLMARRVAHDFNNFIAVVRGYASVLQGRTGLDDDSRELAGFIEQAGAELANMTEGLGRFASGQELNWQRLNLNGTIEDLLNQGEPAIPEGVEVTVQLARNLPDFWGDDEQISQACKNLFQNAIESMPNGGKLSWQTRFLPIVGTYPSPSGHSPSTGIVTLQLTDSGEGMIEETKAHMFAPFFTTKPGKGRGIGATVLYETVLLHGGRLQVTSAPGWGTRVLMSFPSAEHADPGPEHVVPSAESRLGPRVLIVDDDEMVRFTMERMLAIFGYRSTSVATGEEALSIYQESRSDISVVILDMSMPGLSGVETFHRLRSIDDQVRIIIATGDIGNPAVRELEQEGVSCVISKPFGMEELAQAVQEALE